MIVTSADEPRPEGYPGGRTFGLTIRGRRMGAGITLRRCAEAMGISMYDLSQIENGSRPMSADERERFESMVESIRSRR